MKCDHCEKTFRRKVYYELIDGNPHETYCSAECAMKANGIKCASDMICYECGAVIIDMPYTDESGALYCSLACALKANFVDIVGGNEMTPAEEYDSILKCLWFHIRRGEYDMAVPYLKRLTEIADKYGLREDGFRQIATMLKEIINRYD